MRLQDVPIVDSIQARVLYDVLAERKREDDMFGVQRHHPAYWLAILGKQVGQLGEAVVKREWSANKKMADRNMREEAVQVAAVVIAFIEAIDSGELPNTLVTSKPNDPRTLARALNIGDEQLPYEGGETWSGEDGM